MSLEGDEFLNATPPSLLLFLAGLPAAVDGPIPDADTILSICLQSNIPAKQTAISPVKQIKKSGAKDKLPAVSASSNTNVFGSEKSQIIGLKRKAQQRLENDQTTKVQNKPQVIDVFRFRQIHKARAASSQARSSSSSSYYSTSCSGDLSSNT